MWYEILKFELTYRRKRPATYIYFFLVFAITLLLLSTNSIGRMGGEGLVKENAPFVIALFTSKVSLILTLLVSAIMGVPVLRDFEQGTESIMFVNPIRKIDYLLGRFLGSFIVLVLIASGVLFAGLISELLPWRSDENLLPFSFTTYFQPFVTIVLPNLFISATIFFAGGTLSKKSIVVYTQGLILFVLLLIAQSLLPKIDNRTIASLIDPFANIAVKLKTMYWSVSERNSLIVSLDGLFLVNRLAWLAIALAIATYTYKKFSFNIVEVSKKGKKESKNINEATHIEIVTPNVDTFFNCKSNLIRLIHLSVFYAKSLFREGSFLAIVLAGVALLVISSFEIGFVYGHVVLPTTYNMLEMLRLFELFLMIIVIFFTGELVWKERGIKFSPILDSSPIPDSIILAGKFIGLTITIIILLLGLILLGVVIQVTNGYFDIELGLYLKTLFTKTFLFVLFYALLAFFIQVIVNQKYLGIILVILISTLVDFISEWGLEHSLFRFADVQMGIYSDMNKYGHYLELFTWENLYWFGFTSLLFIFAIILSVRGTDSLLKNRFTLSKHRLTRPLMVLSSSSFLLFAFTGSVIYYNTNVMNEFIPEKKEERMQADYEKTLKKFEYSPQPSITRVKLNVEIYPESRDFDANGQYIIQNKTGNPIDEIYIQQLNDKQLKVSQISFGCEAQRNSEYEGHGFHIFKLGKSLQPGDSLTMNFEVKFRMKGFVDKNSNTDLVYNGTFFNQYYFPNIGYNRLFELDDDKKRDKHGLKPRERMLERSDPHGYSTPSFGLSASKIDFEITIGTSNDQIAISPGYLVKSWEENGRNYFHYRMDSPILNFYSILSARYEVVRDTWNGVNLEIYYHKEHSYNLDRMMTSMKESLKYYSKEFGPYQYQQLRIVEFPRYQVFAQSFANTIPFSEGIGFVMDVNRSEYDTPFFVTAHEVAHQWWAHQVCEANTKGATLLGEAVTQYSAMMIMKRHYPETGMRSFLKYELDKYLTGRTTETKKELPLADVENQMYIHYNKGAIIMYAFQDYIGEDSVNAALRRYIADWKDREDRFPSSDDLLKRFDEVTPDSLKYLIEDFFQTITFYECKTEDVEVTKTSNGNYKIDLAVNFQKFRADSLGNEVEIPANDWIDIGVFTKDEHGTEKLLYLKKHKMDRNAKTFTIEVSSLPCSAGIDPLCKMIDKHPKDNIKSII
ncbi:MAG: aminopeptidase [Bacteroidales bacterium]|nr:MAG: aminopeptidase [Bacteroidales bacterium]